MKHDLTANIEQIIHLQAKQCYQEGAALGAILHGLQRWDESILLFEKAINFFKGKPNFESYEVAINLNNIAASFQLKGDLEKAEQAYQQALDIKRKLLGEEHPDIAIILNNLALLFKQKGKSEEAEALFEQAMKIFEKTIGLDHPHTRLCQENKNDVGL
jgi:tetratricopeptide (TPR) repeat protein